jgi:hypothetical protein
MSDTEEDVSMSEYEYAVLDADDWGAAFEHCEGNPSAALALGFRLMALKTFLCTEPPRLQAAIESIDNAIEVLFPHTDFHGVSRDLFLKVIEGKVSVKEERMLNALGIKF